ncbi:MAG TPA: AIM24 family protein, partial [Draconibacterium sp.]|nr:AIM24 family protein [Draconibacterium sp.]
AMHYMQGNLELEANVPGVGKMFKSMVTKEKIIKPVITGTGTVFLQPSFGEFTILELQNDEWILDQGAYYASEMDVEIGAYTNRAISAMFSGEKWIQTVVAGTGKVIITSAGPLEEITLVNDKLVVDGRFAVARTSGIELKVTKASRGIFSTVISGEGLVNTFTGTGKVLIAPVDNYFNTLISILRNIDYKVQNISKG